MVARSCQFTTVMLHRRAEEYNRDRRLFLHVFAVGGEPLEHAGSFIFKKSGVVHARKKGRAR